MENEDIKKYLNNMQIIIQSGNPKHLSYVSKEYGRFRKENSAVALELGRIIATQSHNKGSIYAIFMDKDGTLDLNAISNISSITDVAEFTETVTALSEQEFDFGNISSGDLIISGMQIAEDLAREIEQMEANIDSDSGEVDESSVAGIEAQTDLAEQNAIKLGSRGAGILAILAGVRSRITSIINKIRNRNNKEKEDAEITRESDDTTFSENPKNSEDNEKKSDPFPKVNTPLIIAGIANDYLMQQGYSKRGSNGKETTQDAKERNTDDDEPDLE